MVELFEHNEKAYLQLILALIKSPLATIDHATGLGKSMIALKYMHENKDKRILYLSPTHEIFTQLTDTHMKTLGISPDEFKKLDSKIYSNLLKLDMEELIKDYDIIIVDEYHRCGANKWSKKIFQIRDLIEMKYKDKQLIGLSGTNIRYLDHERNMTEELFRGNCASKINLEDSILKGLLSAPLYICTKMFEDNDIKRIEKKIQKLFYTEEKEPFEEMLRDIKDYIQKQNSIETMFAPYIKNEDGKYIVFNSTIKSIAKNKVKLSKIFKDHKINFYEVHSNLSRESIKNNIDSFVESNKGIDLLFAVDILNEGFHPDGLKGIFMLRHTTSPNMFFQQLGRLLSFSSRNEELIVWDLVGNLYSHKVIYELYENVRKRAKELIIEDPENKERYETILERFKIIDNVLDIKIRMEKIESMLTNEKIMEKRLNRAVKILNDPSYSNYKQKLQAHIDLFKYSEFIDESMFINIEKLNIIKPDVLNISLEEFRNSLSGSTCLHEKNQRDNILLVEEFENFIIKNSRVPNIFSDDQDEVTLARDVAQNSDKLPEKLKSKIQLLVKSDKNISTYMKVYYGINIPKGDYKEFMDELDKVFNNEPMLSKNIIAFLRKFSNNQYNASYYLDTILENKNKKRAKNKTESLEKKLFNFIEVHKRLPEYESDNEDEKTLFLEFSSQSDKIRERFIKIAHNIKYGLNICFTSEELAIKTEEYVKELLEFINIKFRYPLKDKEVEEYDKFKVYNSLLVRFGYKEKLDELVKLKRVEYIESEKKLLMIDLMEFINNNCGDLPSIKVEGIKEASLSRRYSKLKKYFTDNDRKILSDEISRIKNEIGEDFIALYARFITKNKRYPLNSSEDEYEKELAIRYQRNEPSFTALDKERLKRAQKISKRESLKNTYATLLKRGNKI